MIKLRYYQEDAVNACMDDMSKSGNSICVMPTGSGKSILLANIANRVGKPVLILQPSKEILEQNMGKLLHYVKSKDVGVYSASFSRKEIRKYTFATIQSVYKIPDLFVDFDLILCDECDLISPKNITGMFTSFLKGINILREVLGAKPVKIIGVTATPYRNMTSSVRRDYTTSKGNKAFYYETALTLKLINRIKPDFWKRIIYNINNQELFEKGFLCPIRYFDRAQFDHKDIPMNKSKTDFDSEKFAKKLEGQRVGILDLIERAKTKMKSILVFCNSVAEAHALSRQVKDSMAVDGKTPKKDRDDIIRLFREGYLKVVFNVGVLTTGFDHPELDCIFMLRPTRSLRLHYQMCGRLVRIAEGKKEGILIDFTGNTKNLGRIETIELKQEKRLLDARPQWYLSSETADNWHGKELYRFIKK